MKSRVERPEARLEKLQLWRHTGPVSWRLSGHTLKAETRSTYVHKVSILSSCESCWNCQILRKHAMHSEAAYAAQSAWEYAGHKYLPGKVKCHL